MNRKEEAGKLVLEAAGRWISSFAGQTEKLVTDAETRRAKSQAVAIDASHIEQLDTSGAWLLERMRRGFESGGAKAEIVGLDPRYKILLDEVQQTNTGKNAEEEHDHNAVENSLSYLGEMVTGFVRDTGEFVQFLGGVVVTFGRVLVRPWTFRLTSVVYHLDRVGFRSIPIIVLILFLIGGILAQQGIFHFRKFGAETFVVDMVGILVLREVGVLITSIMLAGRSGSAYTAELGSMKMREEVDALRVMGRDPMEILILPRMIALIIALPLLTFIGSMAALFGGMVTAWLYGGFTPEIFTERLRDAISWSTFWVGMIKAPFMGAVIGLVACVEGLRVQGSAESLGEHTTASVVKSIFLVIVLDGAFAIFFASIDW
ncbi:MAG: MlaE family lipid ABC transporter permease subunit [Xanthobacteraceae bacterium]|nr:MlaE family lipid ABC transporter permease subunit [Xanthobacteraceae bacterium]MBX3533603.1 MlaE family lipid ABC transporter permease subunit [Xanthobacteraceae bacterium]MBX3548302.1 MlaE family lipid ABC transporter permease subunit [Xanthobacteraceae bacterium]MCW5675718.1 MlaE family lipid ABC transporter permease subunit [Xanthobacteraceae bacterium]MCW5679235.1 MlaE family lipid ABC transporter permease subunit [Xanthobacteraceae bacterium]